MRPLLKGRVVLVTAGPTREYIDPVRYISNDSSGRMGFELAAAARAAGAEVSLISGPVDLSTPVGVKRIDVVSAGEMLRTVKKMQSKADIIIMAAAVADWQASRVQKEKIKKRVGQDTLTLKLKKTPDILAGICRSKKTEQIIVGFALETTSLLKNAKKKLVKKGCDYIVANLSSTIGSATTACYILSRDEDVKKIPRGGKKIVAKKILSVVFDLKK